MELITTYTHVVSVSQWGIYWLLIVFGIVSSSWTWILSYQTQIVSYFFIKKNNYELDLNPTIIVAEAFHGSNEPQPGCSGIRKDPLKDAMKCIQDEPDDYEDE